jgi:hypothetical protein
MYLKRWDYRRSTIILALVGKPSPASSWTNPYLRSVGMGTGRGDKRVAHFGGSSPCQSTSQSHYRGTKKTRAMIPDFDGNNLLGWTTCMGSPKSLLLAAPSGAESTGLWVETPSWQRLSAVEAEFTHTHTHTQLIALLGLSSLLIYFFC